VPFPTLCKIWPGRDLNIKPPVFYGASALQRGGVVCSNYKFACECDSVGQTLHQYIKLPTNTCTLIREIFKQVGPTMVRLRGSIEKLSSRVFF